MARVKKQYLGVPLGKFGDVVFKNRKGTSYVMPAPNKYKKTECIGAINNRSNFGILSKFASVVTSSFYLKSLWYQQRLPGKSPYTKCLIFNSEYSKSIDSYIFSRITPIGISMFKVELDLNCSKYIYKFSLDESGFSHMQNPFVAVTLIFCIQPIKKYKNKIPYTRFILIEEEKNDFIPVVGESNCFKHKIEKNSLAVINDYDKVLAYTSFVSKNVNSKGKYTCTIGFPMLFKGFDIEKNRAKLNSVKKPHLNKPVYSFKVI